MGQSILQDWVMELPLRHQGVLLTGVRGCDVTYKPGPEREYDAPLERELVAFLRWTFLNPADKRELDYTGAFMSATKPPWHRWRASQLGHLPQHYYSHLMHAFQVVAYKHPDRYVRKDCLRIYHRLVHNMHLMPESEELMDERLTVDRVATEMVVS